MKRFSFWIVTLLLITLTVFTVNRRSSAEKTFPKAQNAENVKKMIQPVTPTKQEIFDKYITETYNTIGLAQTGLDLDVFKKAIVGYYNLKDSGKLGSGKDIISIADFSKSSRSKRLWIVDLASEQLLFNTFVAHGRGSGKDMATDFSNIANSNQSSLGFYVTNETYFGKHGLSLRLDGVDEGFNTNARNRAIVVHGAQYVSQGAINQLGRLGLSHGCPALPVELTKPIITAIKGKTVLFINGTHSTYTSAFLDQDSAAAKFASTLPVSPAAASRT